MCQDFLDFKLTSKDYPQSFVHVRAKLDQIMRRALEIRSLKDTHEDDESATVGYHIITKLTSEEQIDTEACASLRPHCHIIRISYISLSRRRTGALPFPTSQQLYSVGKNSCAVVTNFVLGVSWHKRTYID